MTTIPPRHTTEREPCNYVRRIPAAVERRQHVTAWQRLTADLEFAATSLAVYALCTLIAHLAGWAT